MKVEQLSVFLENKTGRLADVTQVLAEQKISIRALSLADTSDFGILRIIVDHTEEARMFLKKAGFTVGRTAVVAAQVQDIPGGLKKILQILMEHNINVEYMYACLPHNGSQATMIFRFDRIEQAIAALTANGIPLVDARTINGGN